MKSQVADPGIQERLLTANQIIEAIASCGRRFLSMNADRPGEADPNARISRFELVKGRLWYVDKWRGSRIYVHPGIRWRSGWGWRFSDGGTLLALMEHLCDYILKGTPINMRHFGPFPQWVCGGDLWGYGDDMAILRAKVETLLGLGSLPESADHREAAC